MGTTDPYGYHHRQERKRWAPVVASGDAFCAEVRCLMSSRWIPPGSEWHLAHDPSGTRYVGVSHPKCNVSEAATRMHATRKLMQEPQRRWTL
jgi:hypothetical protein